MTSSEEYADLLFEKYKLIWDERYSILVVRPNDQYKDDFALFKDLTLKIDDGFSQGNYSYILRTTFIGKFFELKSNTAMNEKVNNNDVIKKVKTLFFELNNINNIQTRKRNFLKNIDDKIRILTDEVALYRSIVLEVIRNIKNENCLSVPEHLENIEEIDKQNLKNEIENITTWVKSTKTLSGLIRP